MVLTLTLRISVSQQTCPHLIIACCTCTSALATSQRNEYFKDLGSCLRHPWQSFLWSLKHLNNPSPSDTQKRLSTCLSLEEFMEPVVWETKYSVVICRASTVCHTVCWVPGITERTGQTRSLPSQSAPSRVLSGTISVLRFILRVSLGISSAFQANVFVV